MAALVVRRLLRRPSLYGTPTVTFCSVHIHNVVAKKRDASTDLPDVFTLTWFSTTSTSLGGRGGLNRCAFSSVTDVFADPEFAVGSRCLGRRVS